MAGLVWRQQKQKADKCTSKHYNVRGSKLKEKQQIKNISKNNTIYFLF